MVPSARGSFRTVAPETTRMQAFDVIKQVRDKLDEARVLLASAYVGAPSHSQQENALGEVLTVTRKAIERATKVGTDLSQMEMDFDGDTREV